MNKRFLLLLIMTGCASSVIAADSFAGAARLVTQAYRKAAAASTRLASRISGKHRYAAQVAPIKTSINSAELTTEELQSLTTSSDFLAALDRLHCQQVCSSRIPFYDKDGIPFCQRANTFKLCGEESRHDHPTYAITCNDAWHPITEIIDQYWFKQETEGFTVNISPALLNRALLRANAIIKTNHEFKKARQLAKLFNENYDSILADISVNCRKMKFNGSCLLTLEAPMPFDGKKIGITFAIQENIVNLACAIVEYLLTTNGIAITLDKTDQDFKPMPKEPYWERNLRLMTINGYDLMRPTGDKYQDTYCNLYEKNQRVVKPSQSTLALSKKIKRGTAKVHPAAPQASPRPPGYIPSPRK